MAIVTGPPVVLRVDESASVVPSALTVTSREATTTEPLLPMVALVLDEVSAVEVARFTEMPPPTMERICATEVSVPCASTLTSRAPARLSAPLTTRTLPSNEASVRPPAFAVGLLLPTLTATPTATASAKALALLVAVARTTMSAPGTAMSALAPTAAWVNAAEVTSALGVALAPAPRPTETRAELATAELAPMASTVTPLARVMSPSRLAVVALRAVASGLVMPIDTRPPVPASESACAWLFEVARTVNAPSMAKEAVEPTVAATSAPVSTVAPVREPP